MLCLWHVRKAWLENAIQKIKAEYLRVLILQELGDLMYNNGGAVGAEAIRRAKEKFIELKTKYPNAKLFMVYFEDTWMGKIEMWVTGNRNIPHANQDTNAAVENYHGNLKAILRTSRQRFGGRRCDWLIYNLTGDVFTHYWYAVQCKLYGFVKNGKAEGIVAGAVLRAREIPDSHVLIYPNDEDIALVVSVNRFPQVYSITAPNTIWAQCSCPWAQKGNICKHAVKVFKLLNEGVTDHAIIRHAGSLRGTLASGYDGTGIDSFAGACHAADMGLPNTDRVDSSSREPHYKTLEQQLVEVDELLRDIASFARENPSLLPHALSNLHKAKGTLLNLKAKDDDGLLHPLSQPSFRPGPGDGKITRKKSFLDHGSRQ